MYASPILEVDQPDHNQSNRRSVISPSAWVILIRVYVVRFKVLSAADADCHLFRAEIGQDKADYTLRIGTGQVEAAPPRCVRGDSSDSSEPMLSGLRRGLAPCAHFCPAQEAIRVVGR